MDKLNPDALAEWDDEQYADETEVRPGVQRDVTPDMITEYVIAEGALPEPSARPFGNYLHAVWNDWVEQQDITHRDLIAGALQFWRGQG